MSGDITIRPTAKLNYESVRFYNKCKTINANLATMMTLPIIH